MIFIYFVHTLYHLQARRIPLYLSAVLGSAFFSPVSFLLLMRYQSALYICINDKMESYLYLPFRHYQVGIGRSDVTKFGWWSRVKSSSSFCKDEHRHPVNVSLGTRLTCLQIRYCHPSTSACFKVGAGWSWNIRCLHPAYMHLLLSKERLVRERTKEKDMCPHASDDRPRSQIMRGLSLPQPCTIISLGQLARLGQERERESGSNEATYIRYLAQFNQLLIYMLFLGHSNPDTKREEESLLDCIAECRLQWLHMLPPSPAAAMLPWPC